MTPSSARDNTGGVGETIEISASYLGGSGTNTLVLGYAVKSDDNGIKMDGGYQDSNGTWHNFINHTAVTATGTDTVAYRVYVGIDDQSGHKVDGSLTPIGTGVEITSGPADGDTYRSARPSTSHSPSARRSTSRAPSI